MKTFLSSAVLGFLLLLQENQVAAHDFSVCKSSKGDQLGVHTVQFTPDPPQSGRPVQVSVKGISSLDLDSGKVHVDVRVLGITVSSQVIDLCSIVSCPLKAGENYEGTTTQEIPEGTPERIGATVRLSVVDTKGATVSCLESKVEIGGSSNLPQDREFLKSELEFLFDRWKVQFPKAVGNFKVFVDNLIKIVAHNRRKDQTYTMAMNEFGSMTEEEFVESRMGVREPRQDVERNGPIKPRVTLLRQEIANADPPAELDWTAKGVVTRVKNQGSCGSCWAFSAVGALESAYAIKYGELIELSEQELVSCDDNDYGCQGGLMNSAFDWIERSTNGLCTEADYAYTSGTTSARGTCLKDTCTPVPNTVPKGYVEVPQNEAALLAAVSQVGPIAVAIQADQAAFQFYHSGVLTGPCGNHLNHGVLLVGYGVDQASGTPYWKVKNSWGGAWGEQGYIRIQRGKRWPPQLGGACGIASKASYPVL